MKKKETIFTKMYICQMRIKKEFKSEKKKNTIYLTVSIQKKKTELHVSSKYRF